MVRIHTDNKGFSLWRGIKNLAFITVPAFLVLCLILEFIFTTIVPASDMPYRSVIVSPDDAVRFEYRDYGMYRRGVVRRGFPCEIAAHYTINREGWNSNKEYSRERSSRHRIAVIGDSFVEGLSVNSDKTFAESLEKDLQADGPGGVEVYRFGRSGAHLAQYLNMMRYAKREYTPDIYIILISYNDFLEAIRGYKSPYTNRYGDFLQFDFNGSEWREVKPKPYSYSPNRVNNILKKSALFRFLVYNISFRKQIDFFWQAIRHRTVDLSTVFHGHVDTRQASDNSSVIEGLTLFAFSKYKETAGDNSRLLLVMGTDVYAVEQGKDPHQSEAYALNRMVRIAAERLSIPYLDLTDVFYGDFKRSHAMYTFRCDDHWNEKAHTIVGRAISEFIKERKWCIDK